MFEVGEVVSTEEEERERKELMEKERQLKVKDMIHQHQSMLYQISKVN